jgi:hypothetical protein
MRMVTSPDITGKSRSSLSMVSTCQVFFRRAMLLPKVPVISIAGKGWNTKKKKILWAREIKRLMMLSEL